MPLTFGLLLLFIVHLSWQIYKDGNTGNCGCMGQLIPMTPLEAIIKNIISLGIIIFIYLKTPDKKNSLHRYPILIALISNAAVIPWFPAVCCCDTPVSVSPIYNTPLAIDTVASSITKKDTIAATKKDAKPLKKDTLAIKQEVKPKRVMSEFSEFNNFNNGKNTDLNDGKAIVCVFNTTCDHCMAKAKEINEILKSIKAPPIYVLFWSEMDAKGEELKKEIDAFYKFTGKAYPYTMINTSTFFRKLGKASSPPRIAVLNEGNLIGDFSEANFTKKLFLQAIK